MRAASLAITTVTVALLAGGFGCRAARPASPSASEPAPRHTFADISVQQLRADPEAHVGQVFEERFTFSRVWWSSDRKRPGKPSLELPTHFTARIAAAPAYVARIEFPPENDALFEDMREGTELNLRVRFLRLHPANLTPVFAFEKLLPGSAPASDLDYLRR